MTTVTNSFKLLLVLLMIIAGAFDTLVYKTQNKQYIHEGGQQSYFFHPFMQVAAMFLGQILALFIYLVHRAKNIEAYQERQQAAIQQGKQANFNKFWLAIPAMCDCCASNLQLFSLNFIAGSVYQMFRGGTIVTTFIFSLIILKMKAQKNQIVGSILAFIGIVLVGIASMVFAEPQTVESQAGLQIAGYIMLICSLFINGFQFTFEQRLFNKYHIQPLQMVGFEGIFGFTAECIIIAILNFVPCHFGIDACAVNSSGQLFFQNTQTYFTQLGASGLLLSFAILGVFSIMTYNATGVSVTKYINALTRALCDVSRTLVIWIVGIIVTVTLGKSQANYQWQSLQPKEIIMQSFGFVILVFGNLIYNKIITFSWLESHQSQKLQQLNSKNQSQNQKQQNSPPNQIQISP